VERQQNSSSARPTMVDTSEQSLTQAKKHYAISHFTKKMNNFWTDTQKKIITVTDVWH
jgi:hypothetical protein